MALGLKQLRDLVAKWKDAALKENDAYFYKLREQKINEYLAVNKELADLIRETQEALKKAEHGGDALHAIVGKSFWLTNKYNIRKEVFDEGSGYSTRAFEFLNKIFTDREQKSHDIKMEYAKLNERITGCKTAKKAKQMLENMGLDVSSLEETINPPVALEDTPLNLVLMGLKKGE